MGMASLFVGHGVNGVSLDQKFNLTGPFFEYESLENINMDFIVSDLMEDSMIGYTFYDGFNCKDTDGGDTDITENSGYLLSRLRTDLTPIGDGSKERNVKVNLRLDPNQLTSSPLYHEKDGSDGSRATVEFCLRMSIYSEDKESLNAMEVNFLENLVTLDINLASDFELDVQLAASDRVVEQAYRDLAVEGYICDSDDNSLLVTQESLSKNQGETIRICVSPTKEALEDGARMKSLEEFTFSLADGSYDQVAIQPGTGGVAADLLTTVSCEEGQIVCAFETLLNANFFTANGPNVVLGKGSAFLTISYNENNISTTDGRQLRNFFGKDVNKPGINDVATKKTMRTLQIDADGLSATTATPNELLSERPTNYVMQIAVIPVEAIDSAYKYVNSAAAYAKGGNQSLLLAGFTCITLLSLLLS